MLEQILAIAGTIAVIGSAGAVIYKVVVPVFKIVKRVEVLEECSKKDYDSINKQANFDKALAKALISILEHMKDGNHTGEMRDASIELQRFLIDN